MRSNATRSGTHVNRLIIRIALFLVKRRSVDLGI